jgi:predicted lipoprotein with Yx(FWY)xxD motif
VKNVPTFRCLVLAVSLLAFPTMSALADHHAVKLAEKEGVGKFMTDTRGMTLYIFKKDSPGKSACSGPCVEKWPLYYRETVAAPAELAAADFGVITREDGNKQTTYKGWPLYYFSGDKAPGDTAGQGFGGVWFVADPANLK